MKTETGGLIRLLTRLLEATSPLVHKPNLHPLTTMLGRAYALRDDYQNLSSDEYTETKGFCDDLNEGKYSLPLLHALQNLPPAQSCVLQNILTQRRVSGSMSADHKHVVLGMMKQAGSLEYTLGAVRLLQDEVDRGIAAVEAETGVENPELRAIVEMIRV
jgi:geranylgeranyl pyrophosphate synthase